MNTLKKTLLAASLFAIAGAANAMPITGTILSQGFVTTDTGALSSATVFTFTSPVSVTSDGSFAALNGGSVTYSILTTPAVGSTAGFTAVSPLWNTTVSSTNYSFKLTGLSNNSWSGITRSINGSGLFTIGSNTGSGTWNFSSQNPGLGNPATFSFSVAQSPEPAVALLLGAGLIGFGFARKARKAA